MYRLIAKKKKKRGREKKRKGRKKESSKPFLTMLRHYGSLYEARGGKGKRKERRKYSHLSIPWRPVRYSAGNVEREERKKEKRSPEILFRPNGRAPERNRRKKRRRREALRDRARFLPLYPRTSGARRGKRRGEGGKERNLPSQSSALPNTLSARQPGPPE